MREIVHIQAGQCGNQIGAKVKSIYIMFGNIYLSSGKLSLTNMAFNLMAAIKEIVTCN
jgi:hypothetical protein